MFVPAINAKWKVASGSPSASLASIGCWLERVPPSRITTSTAIWVPTSVSFYSTTSANKCESSISSRKGCSLKRRVWWGRRFIAFVDSPTNAVQSGCSILITTGVCIVVICGVLVFLGAIQLVSSQVQKEANQSNIFGFIDFKAIPTEVDPVKLNW